MRNITLHRWAVAAKQSTTTESLPATKKPAAWNHGAYWWRSAASCANAFWGSVTTKESV